MTTYSQTQDTPSDATVQFVIGWMLVVTALMFTIWSALRGGNAFFVGQRLGELIGIGLVLTLPAWLVTRNGKPSTQAYGVIVVGVLLWMFVGYKWNADAKEKLIGQAFLRDAIAMNAVHTQKFKDLNERFAQVDLSNVLTPASVTSASGIAKAREEVAQFRDLVAARDALLKQNLDDVRKLVDKLPAGPTKAGATPTVAKRRTETVRAFRELSKAQLAHLDVVSEMLDWFAAQGHTIKNVGGQLQYTAQAQGVELKALLAKLNVAAAAADKAVAAATTLEKGAEERKADSLKRATELLK